MLSSAQLSLSTAQIHLRHTDLDDQISVAVARDMVTRKIKGTLNEEIINYDVLDKLCTMYTALKAVYDSFEN